MWNGREKEFSDYVFDENVTIHVIELKKYIEHKKQDSQGQGPPFFSGKQASFTQKPLRSIV